jgi:hypothetical protein
VNDTRPYKTMDIFDGFRARSSFPAEGRRRSRCSPITKRAMCLRRCTLLLGCVWSLTAFSQANGIRFLFPQLDPIYKNDGAPSAAFGFGYDHDFNDRLSMGVDITFLGRSILTQTTGNGYNRPIVYGSLQANWIDRRRTFSMVYRTAYSFGDNDSFTPYLGTYIGVRMIGRDLEITDVSDPQSYYYYGQLGPFSPTYLGKATVFPVGLRFGLRSGLDGIYYDLYGGLGYQLGGGSSLFNRPELASGPFDLKGVVWQVGFAYGVGW